MALTLLGVDIDYAQLGAIQLGAIDPTGAQLGAIQLGAIQLGAIQLGAIGANAATIGNTQLGAIQLGAIQLGAITLDATQLGAIGGKSGLVAAFCNSGLDCSELGLDPAGPFVGDELDDYSLLALGAMGADLLSTQLGAIQLGAIQLGAIGSLENTQLGAIQLGAIQLGAIAPADTQLGAIQLGAIQLGAIQLGAIDWAQPEFAQLGAIQLGAIQLGAIEPGATDLTATQLGAIQLGAIGDPTLIADCGSLAGGCEANGSMTLFELDQVGVLLLSATLADVGGALEDIPLDVLADQGFDIVALVGTATLLDLLPETTISQLPPTMTLGQLAELWVGISLFELLMALLDPAELSWEDVDPDSLAADTAVPSDWFVGFSMAGEPGFVPGAEFPFTAEVSVALPDGVVYVAGSAGVHLNPGPLPLGAPLPLPEPEIDGNTLRWILNGIELNDRSVVALALATATNADTSTQVAATVNTLGFTATDSLPTLIADLEPNDTFGTATEISGDVVVIGRADSATDVDIFKLEVPAGGSIEAYLNPGAGTDLDLVLFEPGQTVSGELRGPAEAVVIGSLDPTVGIDPTEQDQGSLSDIANTDLAPVFKASLHRGDAKESIVTPPLRNGGTFYLQTTVYNGELTDDTWVERIRIIDPPVLSQCAPRPLAHSGAPVGAAPTIPAGVETLYLMNTELFSNTYGDTETGAVLAAIDDINGVPGAPLGVVIPVESDATVALAYSSWLSEEGNCSVDAANSVAVAVANLLDSYRGDYPSVSSAVIIGGDDQIPFFRVEDNGVVANEREYRTTFTGNNPLVASLSAGMVLTDAPYTDANPLYVPAGDREVFVSQLPLGRLVEEPIEIVASLEQYVFSGGALDTAVPAGSPAPTAEVFGYDFLADSTTTIAALLTGQGFTVGGEISETWTRQQLSDAMDSGPAIVDSNAHYDHEGALPAAGNLTSDFSDLYTVGDLKDVLDIDGRTLYSGTLIYTMGCHAGLNAPGAYLSVGDADYDWAQALLGRQAVYVANTGFGYGDSDIEAYSEELMALLTEQFATNDTIGEAWMSAQQIFASQTPNWSPYHDKSLMEATLYGLPFYRLHDGVSDPAPVIPKTETIPVGSDGLEKSDSTIVATALIVDGAGGPGTTDRFLVADDVLAVPFRPLQPLEYKNITASNPGLRATGAIIEGGTTTDLPDFDVLYARPILYDEDAEPEYETFGGFPNSLQAVASYELAGLREDRLMLARGRYFPSTNTQQVWDTMDVTVYYAPVSTVDITPPQISRVAALDKGADGIDFSVDASDVSGVVRVLVLYKSAAGTEWTPLELALLNGEWVGHIGALAGAENLDFWVQVLGGDGQVTSSTNKRVFHNPQPPAPPGIQVTGTLGNNGIYTTMVQATLTGPPNAPGVPLEYSIDGEAYTSYSPEESIVLLANGQREIVARPVGVAVSEATLSFEIDTTPPLVIVEFPVAPSIAEHGGLRLQYFCLDVESDIAKCEGTVVNGAALDTSVLGNHEAQVTATDRAGNTTSVAVPYEVQEVAPDLTLDASVQLVGVNTVVPFTGTYAGDDEHQITWTFGDGTTLVQPTLDSDGLVAASHEYTASGVYPVTLTVLHAPGLVQSTVLKYIVVYDPSEGFVTGGGWFDSPQGAYTPDDLTDAEIVGVAEFGFVSKYKKGANVPTGNTTFEFAAGNIEFYSTSYEHLVVTGNKAQYKGVGIVEGQGEFKFRLTVRDADINTDDSFDTDAFRIQIWKTVLVDGAPTDWVLYDNGLGVDPSTYGGTTELGGGSIKIHVPKKGAK